MTTKPTNAKELKTAIDALRDAGGTFEVAHDKAWTKITEAWGAFGEVVMTELQAIEEARANYNLALETATGVVADAAEDLEEKISGKSEKWHEGTAGAAANATIEALRSFDSNYVELDALTLSSLPDIDTQGVPDLDAGDHLAMPEFVTHETSFDDAEGLL